MKELTITLGSLFFLSPAISNAQPAHFIESQGFTIEGLWRGALGMVAILLIAYLFSNNRRAVNWRTVGIGLLLQLCIAVGILKVNFIQKGFDAVG
ncbi:MAG: Na+ dependent nucleoside transporter, partial [Capnocytophaga sp.]|nr:Na+ dependent nucleoside transporter [Capnocytophaga sp.]